MLESLAAAVPARELSRQLRTEMDGFLTRRRGVVALVLASAASMGVIALYQMGIIAHLPEPPLPGLDGDAVDASADAYGRLGTPDAVLGVVNYAATLALAAMGARDRAVRQPWIPIALAAKASFDVAEVARMGVVQWTRHRAFCFWCLVAATATVAAAPLTLSEAAAARAALTRKGRRARSRPCT